jgi:hypothetical protein
MPTTMQRLRRAILVGGVAALIVIASLIPGVVYALSRITVTAWTIRTRWPRTAVRRSRVATLAPGMEC